MSETPKHLAVLVLPRGARAALSGSTLARWMARGDLVTGSPGDVLTRLASTLGSSAPVHGRAALRYWGQTGRRPAAWIAAADPVYLEPRLDHLLLHALDSRDVEADLGEVVGALDAMFGSDADGLRFLERGGLGYLVADAEPFATPAVSPAVVSGREPSEYLPEGPDAAGFHRLQSEIQMLLHESPVAERRIAAGQRPLNGLWLWGGGCAPEPEARPLPDLYGDAPVLAGFWAASAATIRPWPGSLSGCLAASDGFVASLPDDGTLCERLDEARRLLASGAIRQLVLLFAGGIDIRLRSAHRFRFWRRRDALAPFGEPAS